MTGGSGCFLRVMLTHLHRTLFEIQFLNYISIIGLVRNSYPQRVNACFGYLDSEGVGYFTNSQFIEKGSFVEPYLCLNITNNDESRISSFNIFDIDGNGFVPIEEFSFVIMEFLNNTAEGKGRASLESIALNIMPGGLKSAMELLLLVIL
jgi:hypothetical protein